MRPSTRRSSTQTSETRRPKRNAGGYVLDELLEHQSQLRIEEHYTDTAGFTDHVFALMHLLGFKFAPRIRDLADKKLYLPANHSYGILDPLCAGPLNLPLIRTHWPQILRMGASIASGTVSASLLLRKLGAYPRQNGLTLALREVGRLERSLFVLQWLQDTELRRRVHVGLNKGEARNALARAVHQSRSPEPFTRAVHQSRSPEPFTRAVHQSRSPEPFTRAVFFHRLVEVRDRSFENQRHRASGLNLVCAPIILWNTAYLQRAVQTIRTDTPDFNDELLAYLPSGMGTHQSHGRLLLEPTRPPQTRAFQTATPFYHPLTDFNFLFLWAPPSWHPPKKAPSKPKPPPRNVDGRLNRVGDNDAAKGVNPELRSSELII